MAVCCGMLISTPGKQKHELLFHRVCVIVPAIVPSSYSCPRLFLPCTRAPHNLLIISVFPRPILGTNLVTFSYPPYSSHISVPHLPSPYSPHISVPVSHDKPWNTLYLRPEQNLKKIPKPMLAGFCCVPSWKPSLLRATYGNLHFMRKCQHYNNKKLVVSLIEFHCLCVNCGQPMHAMWLF